MKVLDLVLEVDRIKNADNYSKKYEYWSVDENGTKFFINIRENYDFLDSMRGVSGDTFLCCNDYVWEYSWADKPFFIPYKEIRIYDEVEIEIDDKYKIPGCSFMKYPLVSVRGRCNRNCKACKADLYCFRGIPCTNQKPDLNVYTQKNPDFFRFLHDVVKWIELCSDGLDALAVLFTFTPIDNCLDFDMSYAMLINQKKIRVIGDPSEVEALYNEYNTKYPTEHREYEELLRHDGAGNNFKF